MGPGGLEGLRHRDWESRAHVVLEICNIATKACFRLSIQLPNFVNARDALGQTSVARLVALQP